MRREARVGRQARRRRREWGRLGHPPKRQEGGAHRRVARERRRFRREAVRACRPPSLLALEASEKALRPSDAAEEEEFFDGWRLNVHGKKRSKAARVAGESCAVELAASGAARSRLKLKIENVIMMFRIAGGQRIRDPANMPMTWK